MMMAIYLRDVSEERPLYKLLDRIGQVFVMGGLPLPDSIFLESPLYRRLKFEAEEKEGTKVKTLEELAAEKTHGRELTWQFPQGAVVVLKELGGVS